MSILKSVPKRSSIARNGGLDERRQFFIDNANSTNYYYMPIGDVPQHPHRNTLVPLGTFLGFINYNGQVPIEDNKYANNNPNHSYLMRFSNYPYNSTGPIGMEKNPLVYTDYPPDNGSAVGSAQRLVASRRKAVPPTYTNYLEQFSPGTLADSIREGRPLMSGDGITGWGVSLTKGGKKTMQKSKNKKTNKTRKYQKKRRNNK